MEPIRSSIPESLKELIRKFVDDPDIPINTEAEFVRMACGSFATRMQSISAKAVRDNTVMWDDILHVIFNAGPTGISTKKLELLFRGTRGIYYHLSTMRDRGLVEMKYIEGDGDGRSGIWTVTDIGIYFHDIRAYKYT